jgi:hypothetical protein
MCIPYLFSFVIEHPATMIGVMKTLFTNSKKLKCLKYLGMTSCCKCFLPCIAHTGTDAKMARLGSLGNFTQHLHARDL